MLRNGKNETDEGLERERKGEGRDYSDRTSYLSYTSYRNLGQRENKRNSPFFRKGSLI